MNGRIRPPAAALAATLTTVLLSCASPRERAQNDWALLGLAGEVQQVTTRTYYAGNGSGDLASGGYTVTVFDRDGFLAAEKYFSAGDELTGYRSLERDRSGRAVEEQSRTAAGKLESRVTYRYDERGRLTSEEYFDREGTPTGSYAYQYHTDGRLQRRLMEASYSDGSRRSNEVQYAYDAAGCLIEESFREEGLGRVALRVTYAYEGGRRAYRSDYMYGAWLQFRTFYSYDENGNVTQELCYQIPEGEDSAVYEALTRADRFPKRLLGSRTTREYKYFQAQSR